ncbi:MgtC family protein [Geotalea daltonii FRC-32]|uniref:MgtC family protein n=1 Tax=Geotalea daltonii (strain DSM 22248 / JCM 15807 / FRC-32) TaxID=316067 RepID=B9LZJ1_GEODF|nr:MgtC/SapB family protein [Geotalea daltonii]ACM20744.1 MgtC family protein [Geotalea daltonii FRC-32]
MSLAVDVEMVVRLLLASLLGGIIGLEREIHGRPAGFRTHLLVSLGSSLFVVSSIEFYWVFGNFNGTLPVGVDPGRVAAQVVTGIGFLGAGAIIRENASVRGLTTAACLWIASAIGIACGIGLFGIASVVTGISLVSLLFLKRIERVLARDVYATVKVSGNDREGLIADMETLMNKNKLEITAARIEKNIEEKLIHVEYDLKLSSRNEIFALIDKIALVTGVKKVSFT